MKSSISIVILAALVTASTSLSSAFSLDVSRVLSGELWRLLTGHLSHLTWEQYAWDSCAFVLLFSTHSRISGISKTRSLSVIAAAIISITVVLKADYQFYGGLSGISCALCAAVIAERIRLQPRSIVPYAMLFALAWYLLRSVAVSSGVSVAHEAHVAGALSGFAFAVLIQRKLVRHKASATESASAMDTPRNECQNHGSDPSIITGPSWTTPTPICHHKPI